MTEKARQQLGERIRLLRKEQNLTVRGFGLMVGLSKDYIIDLEFGRKSPTLDTLIKLAGGFGISPSELLDGIGMSTDSQCNNTPTKRNPTPTHFHSFF